jgi:hypothetical protein
MTIKEREIFYKERRLKWKLGKDKLSNQLAFLCVIENIMSQVLRIKWKEKRNKRLLNSPIQAVAVTP